MSEQLAFYILNDFFGDIKVILNIYKILHEEEWIEISYKIESYDTECSYLISYDKFVKLRNTYLKNKIIKIKNYGKRKIM